MNARDTNQFDADELRRRAALLRCIVGNPFRPEARDPAWMTLSVVALASAIYNERSSDRRPSWWLRCKMWDATTQPFWPTAAGRASMPEAVGWWVRSWETQSNPTQRFIYSGREQSGME